MQKKRFFLIPWVKEKSEPSLPFKNCMQKESRRQRDVTNAIFACILHESYKSTFDFLSLLVCRVFLLLNVTSHCDAIHVCTNFHSFGKLVTLIKLFWIL